MLEIFFPYSVYTFYSLRSGSIFVVVLDTLLISYQIFVYI